MDGRDASTGDSLDLRTVLNALYENEINASIAWIRDRGFRATLGNPRLAKKWFQSSGEAVGWLSHQALVCHSQSEFARAPGRVVAHIDTVLDDLYANNIGGSISWIWDGGFYVTLGAPKQTDDWAFPSSGEAVAWLIDQAACITPTASSRANTAASCE